MDAHCAARSGPQHTSPPAISADRLVVTVGSRSELRARRRLRRLGSHLLRRHRCCAVAGDCAAAPGVASPDWAVAPLGPTLGAEVTGVDLSRAFTDAERSALTALFLHYKVLFFRSQSLTSGDQVARVAELQAEWDIVPRSHQQRLSVSEGGVFVHPFLPQKAGARDVWPVRYDPPATPAARAPASGARGTGSWSRRTQTDTSSANVWHSDNGFLEEPSSFTLLHARVLPEMGGDTLFADMAAAFADLSDERQEFYRSLTAVFHWQQTFPHVCAAAEATGNWEGFRQLERDYPPVEHPVVRVHPVTGVESLFANADWCTEIKGMGSEEGDAVLREIYALASIPEYQCRFTWQQPGDCALWDNRNLQHYAVSDFGGLGAREMEHVASLGERPFGRHGGELGASVPPQAHHDVEKNDITSAWESLDSGGVGDDDLYARANGMAKAKTR